MATRMPDRHDMSSSMVMCTPGRADVRKAPSGLAEDAGGILLPGHRPDAARALQLRHAHRVRDRVTATRCAPCIAPDAKAVKSDIT